MPKHPEVLPVKSGNYSDNSSATGVKLYEFTLIDKEGRSVTYPSPYTVARKLGLDIKHYMDLPELLEQHNFFVNGFKVKMEEM